MADSSLRVFAAGDHGVSLGHILAALHSAGARVQIDTTARGCAEPEDLDRSAWEAAFVRWTMPEIHEVWLLERSVAGRDEDADAAIEEARSAAESAEDRAGQFLVTAHLDRAKVVYSCHILPALMAEPDHEAWGALDCALRAIATETDGLIYAAGEAFYDADGEELLDLSFE